MEDNDEEGNGGMSFTTGKSGKSGETGSQKTKQSSGLQLPLKIHAMCLLPFLSLV